MRRPQGASFLNLYIVIILAHSVALTVPKTVRAESSYPIQVMGISAEDYQIGPIHKEPIEDPVRYDVIIVGGGLAGLTASLYLSDQGKKVLLLEKTDRLGGLAAGGTLGEGTRYAKFGRGGAYWTDAYKEELAILTHIGLGDYREKYAIYEPIDGYLWNGVLYNGVWDPKTLKKLPASFELFRSELKHAYEEGEIPDQPIEEAQHLELDTLTAAQWISQMPEKASQRTGTEAEKIFGRFKKDRRLNPANPMSDVIHFLDLYCRSALGTSSSEVSALAFANFYISEIDTRFASEIGTGKAAELLVSILKTRPEKVTVRVSASVTRINPLEDSAEVTYMKDRQPQSASAKYVIYAAQLGEVPKIVENLDREHAEILRQMEFAHYSVHVVELKGHPYRAAYDTWVRSANYTENDFTDVVLGRWMDPAIRGYQLEPQDDEGLMTIYHPLSKDWMTKTFSRDQASQLAENDIEKLKTVFGSLQTQLDVRRVITNRWPFSIHIAKPGHFAHDARILRKPSGRIFFASNNIGTPAFEEALFRGHCAANNVLRRLDPERFQPESWTRCPMETKSP